MDNHKPEILTSNQRKLTLEYMQKKRDNGESDGTRETNEDLGIIADNEL
jgi:hypothetical protein